MEMSTEDQELEHHKEIVKIKELSLILSNSLVDVIGKFLLVNQKELDEKVKIDIIFNSYISFFYIMISFFDSLGVSIKQTLTVNDVIKSQEIIDLESEYGSGNQKR